MRLLRIKSPSSSDEVLVAMLIFVLDNADAAVQVSGL